MNGMLSELYGCLAWGKPKALSEFANSFSLLASIGGSIF